MIERTIKCKIISIGISYCENIFQNINKTNKNLVLTYFDIAKAWETTGPSNSFSQAINDDHYYYSQNNNLLILKWLTWIVNTQVLNLKN